MRNVRDDMLLWALRHWGLPYVYGANGPKDFDCSGFVLAALRYVGRWGDSDVRAKDIFQHFKGYRVEEPHKACLLFWNGGSSEINHVAIAINDQCCIGAHGKTIRKVEVMPIDYRVKLYGLDDLVAICDPLPGVGRKR